MKRKKPPQADEHIETMLEKKLYHDRKEVRKAAKKAKTFEMQKILKKMKDARQKGDDNTVKNIEAQHMALKGLDSDLIADSALSTKIKKDKFLSQDSSLRSVMSKSLSASVIAPTAPNPAEGTVQSRLLSSKVLAADVARIIKGLRRLLNPEERVCNAEEDGLESPDVSQPLKKKPKTREKEGLHRVPPMDVSIGCEANEDDIEDDGWESGTVSDDGPCVQGDSRFVSMSNGGFDDDRENAAHEGEHSDQIIVSHKRLGPDVNPGAKEPTVESAFLPSLSVGFVRGDSDTDFSDSEVKAADGVKKNRRGQRARRAIWEKKFGTHANHVVKQRDISKASNRSHLKSGGTPIRKYQFRSNSDGAPVADRKARIQNKSRDDFSVSRTSGVRKEDKPLHPSWEAKKKLQKVAIMPAQGTRIVFD